MSKKINWIILIVFAVATFLIGLTHEAWLDEAQSWLTARDCSFFDIMFTRCSYEGTPFLFFYILKIFILFGLSYKYIFIIPWIFACIGVYLFVFKSNFSTIFKTTIPFTFYIFYQYSIIARPYCLLFPVLCLIAIFYQKRFEKPFLYFGLLALLASIHAYGYVIAFVLLCFKVVEDLKSRRFEDWKPLILLMLYMLFVAFICKKNPDCDFVQKNLFLDANILNKLIVALLRGYFNLDTFFSFLSAMLFVPSLYYLSIKTFCRTKRQIMFFIILNFVVYASIVIVNFYDWHLGIILLTLLFSCWILKNVNNIKLYFKNDTVFYVICLVVILTQVFFSVKNSYLEIQKEYDGAKTVANYIKENNFKKEEMIGFVARVSAIQPYFSENIFANKDTAYYSWSRRGLDDEMAKTKKILPKAKVFITDEDILEAVLFKDIFEYLYDNFYEDIVVESDMYIKGKKFPSSTTYHIFRRIENNL